jgi:hypothetical protein
LAEDTDAYPHGEGEKTVNPVLKTMKHYSHADAGQGFSEPVTPELPPPTPFSKKMAKEFPFSVLALAPSW